MGQCLCELSMRVSYHGKHDNPVIHTKDLANKYSRVDSEDHENEGDDDTKPGDGPDNRSSRLSEKLRSGRRLRSCRCHRYTVIEEPTVDNLTFGSCIDGVLSCLICTRSSILFHCSMEKKQRVRKLKDTQAYLHGTFRNIALFPQYMSHLKARASN